MEIHDPQITALRPRSFSFEIECDVWQKSDAGEREWAIGGVCSTDDLDRQSEIVLQEGMDFDPFLKYGWFNDNHIQDQEAVVGYPTLAEMVDIKGGMSKGWKVEGYLLKGVARAQAIYSLAMSLKKANAPRNLGFSVEGGVLARDPAMSHIVQKAVVRNVAITHCPVNTATSLSILAKSLAAGSANPIPRGEPTTEGRVLVPQSIEANKISKLRKRKKKLSDLEERVLTKAEHGERLNKSEAISLLKMMAGPKLTDRMAAEIVDFTMRHNPL